MPIARPVASALTAALALSFALAAPAAPAAADFAGCVAGLKAEARRAGVSAAIVRQAFDIRKPDEKVLRALEARPEFKTPIWDYMAFLVDDERVRDGRAMLKKHFETLRRAEKRYGVSRYIIVAVWGVESNYGRQTGSFFLPHALATLTCAANRRRSFWRGQLIEALKLVQRGDLKLKELYGSWAGAFGQTQFIPSVYRRLAVDFDGDGRRDLVNSVPDALASTANYLKRAGWRRGNSWLIEVRLPRGYAGPVGRKRKATLSTWARRGVTRADGRRLRGGLRGGLLLPAGKRGPAFLVFRNFEAIYAYNHAESYALAISHLADRIAGRPRFRTAWPTDDPGLSRAQRRELQRRLLALGHDIGKVDGRIGPITRAAIRKEQARLGMKPTGRAGLKIYRALTRR